MALLESLSRLTETHPLVRYARATNTAEAATAIREARQQKLITDADLKVTAASKAETTLLDQLPVEDAFTLQVKAVTAMTEANRCLESSQAISELNFGALPDSWHEAYQKLEYAQERRVAVARLILMRQEPFYRHYIRALNVVPDTRVGTACVGTEFVIRYCPFFFAGLNLGQIAFVILHEAEHVAYRHITRSHPLRPSFKEKDEPAWKRLLNIAADLEILMRQVESETATENKASTVARLTADIPNTLETGNVKKGVYVFDNDMLLSRDHKIPAGTRVDFKNGFFEKFAADLFSAVVETTDEEKRDWDARVAEARRMIDFDPGSAETDARHDARVASIRNGALQDWKGSNDRGIGHADSSEISVPIRPTPLSSYIERLAGFSHALRGTNPSWNKPSYYSYTTGVFEPSRTRVKEPVLFAFDTSGSISGEELTFAFNCLHGYSLRNLFSQVRLLLWDSEVYCDKTLDQPPDLNAIRICSGGTLLSSVADHLAKTQGAMRPRLTVFVTDGCIENSPRLPSERTIILCTRQENIAALQKIPGATVLWVDPLA